MNATKARGQRSKPAPEPEKGAIKRVPATCSDCGSSCKVFKFNGVMEDGYYNYYDDKLCGTCAKKCGII